MVLQAVTCPTQPTLYIYVDQDVEEQYTLLAFVEDSKIEVRPFFNITGYQIVQAETVAVRESIIENRRNRSKANEIITEESFQSSDITDADIIMDALTEEERRKICEVGIKVVSGRSVEFRGGGTKPSRDYIIELEFEWLIKGNVVRAFECLTDPIVYLHVNEGNDSQKTVNIIVKGERDFEHLTPKFMK